MKNISINKNLTNIFLIDGAFPLDRHKKKSRRILFQKTNNKDKTTTTKKQKKKQKPKQFFFPFQASQENTVYLVL